MENEVVNFLAEDGVVINGYIHKCGNKTNKILIETHGMSSNCFKYRSKIIAEQVGVLGIDSLCYDNRGSELVKYIKDKDGNRKLAGTSYEDVEESYNDILATIKYAVNQGYTSIYLLGHSLGSTKTVYVYNKMKEEKNSYLPFIKGVLLLSLVDIPDLIKTSVDKKYLNYAKNKQEKGEDLDMMPINSFIHPISVKTFLQYITNRNLDIAPYNDKSNNFDILNNISVPLFMRWGNINELIKMNAKDQSDFMNIKIKNPKKDIGYIDGANHSFANKEFVLASEICNFISVYF